MKKIFLLSLLSVFFLSAFCQIINTREPQTEIITKINIIRSADDARDNIFRTTEGYEDPGDNIISWPKWWFLYREVRTRPIIDGCTIECIGFGWKWCMIRLRDIFNANRGLPQNVTPEVLETTCETLAAESEEQAANGVYRGSISKKLAISGTQTEYILFQMNWNYDPENPYNGQAEIIISKTNNFGIRTTP